MGKIAFVTDSTAYLTPDQERSLGISVVPLDIVIDGEAYAEGVDASYKEIYEKMAVSEKFPSTSQPSPSRFEQVFKKLIDSSEHILCLTLSSGLSGTYESAKNAAQRVNPQRITVFDSKITSFGLAGPLQDAVKMARSGCDVNQILEMWQYVSQHMVSRFLIDNLEALRRGGRIGGASALLGSLLQIKPILTVRDGKIDLYEKMRTHRRALEALRSEFHAFAEKHSQVRLGVIHRDRAEDAHSLLQELIGGHENVLGEVCELGPVIGMHTGPGLLALVYYPSKADWVE
ncbi:DegV family protein [Alicyclobacillus tolerans]|uniref:DegV family protein with EDD domain n=1 Tax=Alicyclobacillus tolerans TaxID=90970 RepID=A0ABT9LWH7_9BACL|nr:DegV family protein [Alicyclobacillus tengchongensis]MDP9728632.1 DegV family protein with EDD domain [Alicyclobacillus tengchongensis]